MKITEITLNLLFKFVSNDMSFKRDQRQLWKAAGKIKRIQFYVKVL